MDFEPRFSTGLIPASVIGDWMNVHILLYIVGIVICFVGLATLYLAITREKPNRFMEVLIGIIWVIFGSTIFFLNVKSRNNASIWLFIPISDKWIGIILPIFVFSLFVMKGFLEIRSSLKNKNISSTKDDSILGKFRITIWLIILAWLTIVTLIYLSGSH